MSIIDETGVARYEAVENIEQMQALSSLLNAQFDEERCLFAHAELLAHFRGGNDTASAVLDYWATASGIDVIAAYSGQHRIGFVVTQVKHDVYCGQEVNVAEIVAVYVAQDHLVPRATVAWQWIASTMFQGCEGHTVFSPS